MVLDYFYGTTCIVGLHWLQCTTYCLIAKIHPYKKNNKVTSRVEDYTKVSGGGEPTKRVTRVSEA